MQTVAFLNLKGGVGKSSSVFHLSGVLAAPPFKLRVLAVDNDPQASLTQGFWGPTGAAAVDPAASVAAAYPPGADPDPDVLLADSAFPGLTVLPGSSSLTAWNVPEGPAWEGSQWGLREVLAAAAPRFDLCLIDCPPNLHLCSWSALLAADAVVVPLQPEDFGSQGMAPVLRIVRAAAAERPGLDVAGFLLTMVSPRTGLHQTYETLIRETYGDRVFRSVVPRAIDYPEAVAARAPVAAYKPRSAAARAIRSVAAELLERLERTRDGSDQAGSGEGQGVAA